MSAPDFPRDPVKFKEWADRECTVWPEILTVAASNAWQSLRGSPAYPPLFVDFFATTYANYRAHVLSGGNP